MSLPGKNLRTGYIYNYKLQLERAVSFENVLTLGLIKTFSTQQHKQKKL